MPEPFIHNIDPVLGQIGGMYLWWYGLSYSIGFLGLFHWVRIVRDSLGMDVRQVYDLSILIASGVLIGGRFVEVVFYEWSYYSDHTSQVFWIWLGGMSTHGILLGGTLGTWLFCRIHRMNFLHLADELAVPAAFIMGLGRIGNFVDGQIVGDVTDVWWAVKFPDAEGLRRNGSTSGEGVQDQRPVCRARHRSAGARPRQSPGGVKELRLGAGLHR
jgi:phosphatidylglycerol:prolipoprotein diacylglycerol transferase